MDARAVVTMMGELHNTSTVEKIEMRARVKMAVAAMDEGAPPDIMFEYLQERLKTLLGAHSAFLNGAILKTRHYEDRIEVDFNVADDLVELDFIPCAYAPGLEMLWRDNAGPDTPALRRVLTFLLAGPAA